MKDLVEETYDKIAKKYTKDKDEKTLIFAKMLEDNLKKGMRILDAGCGGGIPIAKYLSKNFKVYGIDISKKQIEIAKKNVPKGNFRKMNMLNLKFKDEFFDGIICMYSLIHVDRKNHLEILRKFYNLLKPKGFLLVCMGRQPVHGVWEYYGKKMFWSHFGKRKNKTLVKQVGFEILFAKEWNPPEDENDRHLFILAKKPFVDTSDMLKIKCNRCDRLIIVLYGKSVTSSKEYKKLNEKYGQYNYLYINGCKTKNKAEETIEMLQKIFVCGLCSLKK